MAYTPVKVWFIGIGAPSGAPIPIKGEQSVNSIYILMISPYGAPYALPPISLLQILEKNLRHRGAQNHLNHVSFVATLGLLWPRTGPIV